MSTVRDFAREHPYGPLEPVRVTAYVADKILDKLQGGDDLSWTDLDRYSEADVDSADLFLIRCAYDRDMFGRDLISEVNYEVLQEDCGEYLIRVTYHNTNQWALKADMELPDEDSEDWQLRAHLESLESYPILDEDRWSALEWEVKEEDWEDYGRDDFRGEIARAGGDPGAFTDEQLDTAMIKALEDGKVDQYHDGSTVWHGLHDVAQELAILQRTTN